ncbi:MAG: FAD-dependent oxidoreductase, partial [Pseudomonadota bacterium]
LAAPVRTIRTTPEGVLVKSDAGQWSGDHVVVAVPPPIARGIDFAIPRKTELDLLLAGFVPGDLVKTVAVFEKPFWRLKGLRGSVVFADPAGLSVVDGSNDVDLPRLIAFAGGPLARTLANLPPSGRQTLLLQELRRVFGEEMPPPCEIAEAVWVDDPWSGGGYSATLRPGASSDTAARLADWEGRVHFAGAEIAATFPGYVEGALTSGRAAIARILDQAPATQAPAKHVARAVGGATRFAGP